MPSRLTRTICERTIAYPVPSTVNHAIYESTPAPLHTMSLTQWNKTLETNLTGGFLVVRQYLKRLVAVREQYGINHEWLRNVAVIFIGSTGSSHSLPSLHLKLLTLPFPKPVNSVKHPTQTTQPPNPPSPTASNYHSRTRSSNPFIRVQG